MLFSSSENSGVSIQSSRYATKSSQDMVFCEWSGVNGRDNMKRHSPKNLRMCGESRLDVISDGVLCQTIDIVFMGIDVCSNCNSITHSKCQNITYVISYSFA